MFEKIGRYDIIEELGRGGMATVYLARDPNMNRQVAIKLMPSQFTHDPRFRSRFLREAQTIANLEHPAIVPVYDFGEIDNLPYLVMRYMQGGSLADRIAANGAIPLEETVSIVERIAGALDHAHSRRITHRDLKPGNVLFDQYGDAYLADFGIVKIGETSGTFSGSAIIGTPAYMSPEQAQGGATIDSRTDIYALGIIVFEMLTGKAPYEGDTPVQQLMQHIIQPVPRILEVNAKLPPSVEPIVTQALSKIPDERPKTGAAIAAALAAAAHSNIAPLKRPVNTVWEEAPTLPPRQPARLVPARPQNTLTDEAPLEIQPSQAGMGGGTLPDHPPIQAEAPSIEPIAFEPLTGTQADTTSRRFNVLWLLPLLLVLVGLGLGAAYFLGGDDGSGGSAESTAAPTANATANAAVALTDTAPAPTDTPTQEPSPAPTNTDIPPSPIPEPIDVPIALTAVAAQTVQEILPEFPSGDVTLAGVDFNIEGNSKISTQCQATPDEAINLLTVPQRIIIPTGNVVNAEKVHLLLNAGFTAEAEPDQLGFITLIFSDGTTYQYELILNKNIREWGIPVEDALSSPDLQEAYRGPNRFGDQSVIDLLTITVPDNLRGPDKILTDIALVDTSQTIYQSPNPCIFISGLSVSAP